MSPRAAGSRWYSRSCPVRVAMASTNASPAAGPSLIDTATARLSSITGGGRHFEQPVVEDGDG